jgi:hypothetical protein
MEMITFWELQSASVDAQQVAPALWADVDAIYAG